MEKLREELKQLKALLILSIASFLYGNIREMVNPKLKIYRF